MISYSKTHLDTLAQEYGFIRDNLEKVLRLGRILTAIHDDELLCQSLVLKGGTAINLVVFDMPRLSVDIDLDYAVNCPREEMLKQREVVNATLMRYMASEGYRMQPTSKSPHSLDSWVFGYTNAGGNPDNVKIEINYSDRCHVLPMQMSKASIGFMDHMMVRTLHPIELFASKINALVNRGAMRDLYDVHNMIAHRLFVSEQDRDLLRKTFVFYHAVGATSKAEEVSLQFDSFPKIEAVEYTQVRAQLIPVLSRAEKFDYETVKTEVIVFLKQFLQFNRSEYQFVELFNQREYHPEILFGPTTTSANLSTHPMALWKCRPK